MKTPGCELRYVLFNMPLPCKISAQKHGIVNATGATPNQWLKEPDSQCLPFFWIYQWNGVLSFLKAVALGIYHNFASIFTSPRI